MRIPVDNYKERNQDGYLIIPTEFQCRDGKFKQIRRVNDLALYQRDSHFEVIYVQNCNPFEVTPGVFTEKKEGWPNDNSFGTLGWTYQDLAGAERKFNQLLNPETKIAPQVVNNQVNPIIKRKRGRPPGSKKKI